MIFRVVGRYTLYLTSLFVLDDVYSATTNTMCYTNGNSDTFSDLKAAKISCSADADCVGLFDSCGRGTQYLLCNAPLSISVAGCGSILYQQGK